MKRKLTLWMSAAALLLTSTPAMAQTINMGSSPINFGPGCLSSFIQNTNNGNKLAFGANQYCFGPTYSLETIWMNTDAGRLGIGVSNPSYQIHLSANSAGKPGSSTWTVTSDRRFKQDIHSFTDGLAMIRQINPVTFHYNEQSGYDTRPEYVGVIAQEMQEVAPYMVQQVQREEESGAKTEYLAVDFGAMDFALINAVKELDGELQYQRAENEALRSSLEDLRNELNALRRNQGDHALSLASVAITPNPSSDVAELSYSLPKASQKHSLQVWSLEGEMVSELPLTNDLHGSTQLDVRNLAAGTYIVKLVSDGQTVATQRLVTQH